MYFPKLVIYDFSLIVFCVLWSKVKQSQKYSKKEVWKMAQNCTEVLH